MCSTLMRDEAAEAREVAEKAQTERVEVNFSGHLQERVKDNRKMEFYPDCYIEPNIESYMNSTVISNQPVIMANAYDIVNSIAGQVSMNPPYGGMQMMPGVHYTMPNNYAPNPVLMNQAIYLPNVQPVQMQQNLTMPNLQRPPNMKKPNRPRRSIDLPDAGTVVEGIQNCAQVVSGSEEISGAMEGCCSEEGCCEIFQCCSEILCCLCEIMGSVEN